MASNFLRQSLSDIELSRQRAIEILENRKNELFRSVPTLRRNVLEQNNLGLSMSKEILKKPSESAKIVKGFQEKSYNLIKENQKILKSLGLPDDYLDPPYSCKKCEDTGFISDGRCSCLENTILKKTHNHLNDSSSLKLVGFDQFNLNYYPDTPDSKTNIIPKKAMEDIFDFTKKYVESFTKDSKNLLFLGGTGLGKTHLSLSIADSVIKKGFGVIYGSAPNLIGKIENEKFGRSSNNVDTLSSLLDVDLLILDDLGSEFQTQFTVSTIYTIINTRLSKNLPLIISTNYDYNDLEKAYTQRVFSRIVNNYETLFFWGNDIRRIIKNEENKG